MGNGGEEKVNYMKREEKMSEEKLFDIAGFKPPEHKSRIYRMFLNKERLLKAISDAIDKGVTVISIREVIKPREKKK